MGKGIIYLFFVLAILLLIFGCGRRKIDERENLTVVYGENRTTLEEVNVSLENKTGGVEMSKIHEENSDLDFLNKVLEESEKTDSDLDEVSDLIRQ